MNKWEKLLGIEYPGCQMCGQCCYLASPSLPALKMLKKAAQDDPMARDFFNIFIPYNNIDEVKAIAPEHVNRTFEIARKSEKFSCEDKIVFFYCRFLADDNKCLIHEDRPQLCRDYPDTPFLLIPPGCAYENWSKECKQKYYNITDNLKLLKDIQKSVYSTEMLINTTNNFANSRFLLSPAGTWLS